MKLNLTDEGSKSHHESDKEPDPGSHWSEAAVSETLSAKETVGDEVDHDEGDGGKHSAQVEDVTCILQNLIQYQPHSPQSAFMYNVQQSESITMMDMKWMLGADSFIIL